MRITNPGLPPLRTLLLVLLPAIVAQPDRATQCPAAETEPGVREPISITLIPMDLTAAQSVILKHDLNDDGSLNKAEQRRLLWSDDEVRRFDLDQDGDLQHLEIALKLADARLNDGIVQMDSILANRYMGRYDANQDGKLQLSELTVNIFTDQLDLYDNNSDDQLTSAELIRGLAWERNFRTELGIKGCDQGGAMKLLNRGDKNGDQRLEAAELNSAGLTADALDYDRNEDGKLSVSELAERLAQRRNRMGLTPSDQLAARKILTQADRDRDGVISATELASFGPNPLLPKCDDNHDGKVTEFELERFFGNRRRELGFDDEDAKRATILVQRNDIDGSRTLDRSELVASGSDPSSPLSPDKLPLIDTDQDGKLSVDELARYLKKTR